MENIPQINWLISLVNLVA